MSGKHPYRDFIIHYLARGALGVSVGLAGIASVATATPSEVSGAFSERIAAVRSAVSEQVNEPPVLAQVVPRPLPPQPFKNFFGKAPFQDTFKKSAPPPKKKDK
jgi:hypothetical protein